VQKWIIALHIQGCFVVAMEKDVMGEKTVTAVNLSLIYVVCIL
jgi:hypothetical protein